MSRLKNFWIWLDYDCPKLIRWLLHAIFMVVVISFNLVILAILVALGVLCFEIIPNKLQVLGGVWVVIIELLFVIPLFFAIFYGIIYVYLKILRKDK